MRTRSALPLAAALALGATLTGCTTNPTTGRSQLNALSPEQEAQMGDEAAPQLTEEFGGEVQSPELRAYVTEVGRRLADQTEEDGPQREWHFTLLDSPVINAFALPGEHVFMSRGLADKMTNEAQLAGVLGHEIGHVMARHVGERVTQSGVYSGGAQVLGAILGAVIGEGALGQAVPGLVTQGGQVITLKFSRDQESEADSLGVRYMTKAKYNPRGQVQVMQILKESSGGGGGPEWLATHPLPETRIDKLKEEIESQYSFTADNREYGFHADRFKRRYLDVAKTLPPPKQPKPPTQQGAAVNPRSRTLAAINLDDPTTWCAHCAAAAHQQSPGR